MNILNLFWNLNVTDNTKSIIIFSIIVLIIVMCYFRGKKSSNKNKKKHKINKSDEKMNQS